MSDSEDDYMSDKILAGCAKEDVRPGLIFNKTEKRKIDQYKKKIEQTSKKPRTYVEKEKEAREKGMQTALSSENKGFQLLEKMGFKPGTSLGKTAEGIKEPILITIKDDIAGVGRESHLKEVVEQRIKIKENELKKMEQEFRTTNFEKTNLKFLKKDMFKAQRVCEELDFRERVKTPIADYYWTKETINKIKEKQKQEEKSDDDEDDLPEEAKEDEDEQEQQEEIEVPPSEENLKEIIDYVRKNYFYCMYCAITGENENDLKKHCPGKYRIDHSDVL